MKLFECPNGHTNQMNEVEIPDRWTSDEHPVLFDGATVGGCGECDYFGRMELVA